MGGTKVAWGRCLALPLQVTSVTSGGQAPLVRASGDPNTQNGQCVAGAYRVPREEGSRAFAAPEAGALRPANVLLRLRCPVVAEIGGSRGSGRGSRVYTASALPRSSPAAPKRASNGPPLPPPPPPA